MRLIGCAASFFKDDRENSNAEIERIGTDKVYCETDLKDRDEGNSQRLFPRSDPLKMAARKLIRPNSRD